jgi:hypothetical protein
MLKFLSTEFLSTELLSTKLLSKKFSDKRKMQIQKSGAIRSAQPSFVDGGGHHCVEARCTGWMIRGSGGAAAEPWAGEHWAGLSHSRLVHIDNVFGNFYQNGDLPRRFARSTGGWSSRFRGGVARLAGRPAGGRPALRAGWCG